MAAEQGCLTLTAPQVAAQTLVVTPVTPPTAGKADSRREYTALGSQQVRMRPLAVTVVGVTLSINVRSCKAGDMVCWTAYSS
jgi:hypothetical protein